jgi:hypothetical protein
MDGGAHCTGRERSPDPGQPIVACDLDSRVSTRCDRASVPSLRDTSIHPMFPVLHSSERHSGLPASLSEEGFATFAAPIAAKAPGRLAPAPLQPTRRVPSSRRGCGGLVSVQRRRVDLHRSRLALAERVDRVGQRPAPRRVPQRLAVRQPPRSPGDGGLVHRLQRQPAHSAHRGLTPTDYAGPGPTNTNAGSRSSA